MTVVTEHTASPGVHLRAFWKESDGFIFFSFYLIIKVFFFTSLAIIFILFVIKYI